MSDISKHTDLSYLEQLSNGSNEFIRQMISVFMEQTPDTISQMETSLQKGDWKNIAALAHKIKPSFSFMGIKELEPVIMDIEHNCKTLEDTASVPKMLETLKNVCNQAMQELTEEKVNYL